MTSFVAGQLLGAAALNAALAQCFPAGNVSTYSATLLNQTSAAAWYAALGLPAGTPGTANGLATLNSSAQVPIAELPAGVANGLATLDSSGKLPASQLTAAVVGAMVYQGTWNASTNSPTLASSTGTTGQYYRVSVAGTTSINGVAQWNVGDLIAFGGSIWEKIDGVSNEVVSVAGRTGAVTIASTDITDSTAAGRGLLTAASVSAQRIAINFENITKVSDANATLVVGNVTYAWTALTAARTGQLPAAAGYNPGQEIVIADWSGASSPTLTITAIPNGSDTIVGSPTVSSPYGALVLTSDGVSKWQGVQNVSVGTGAGQAVKLTAAGKLPAVDGSLLTNLLTTPFPWSITGGLPTAMSGSNTTAAITVSALTAADATAAAAIAWTGTLSWAVSNGNAANGYAGGTTLPNSSTIHMYACSGGSGTCLYASTTFGLAAASAPAGYQSYVRRIFSFVTTSAGAPQAFTAREVFGGAYMASLATPVTDISAVVIPTSARTLYTMSIPNGPAVMWRGTIDAQGSASGVYVTSPDEPDIAPTTSYVNQDALADASHFQIPMHPVITATAQVGIHAYGTCTVTAYTWGWIDMRRG